MADAAPSAAAASLMHQTNADGVQQTATDVGRNGNGDSYGGGYERANGGTNNVDADVDVDVDTAGNDVAEETDAEVGLGRGSGSGSAPKSSIPKLFRKLCCCLASYSSSKRTMGSNSLNLSRRALWNNSSEPLLPPQSDEDAGKKCLVLDLDETLVHSSFRPVASPDYVVPVEIEGETHYVYVLKRPGTDEFLERMGELYEVVIFTASLAKYADPLLDMLDKHKVIRHRLFRESCTCHERNYVKDMTKLGREISQTIIVDNSPMSYMFQPENAIGISSFIDSMEDKELYYCQLYLESIVDVGDVTEHLPSYSQFINQKADEEHQSML